MGALSRFGLLLVLVSTLTTGCSRRHVPGARGTPSQVVAKLFALRQAGHYTQAATIIDFPALARRCAGELWDIGSDADRAALGRAFEVSWLREGDDERAAFQGASLHFEEQRLSSSGGRAITRVSIQGGRGTYGVLRSIEYTMARYLGRWRIVGQVFEQPNGQTFDEENLCRPMLKLARERAERRRVELTLGDLAQVFLDRLKTGALPER
jgi:hypothetical protein